MDHRPEEAKSRSWSRRLGHDPRFGHTEGAMNRARCPRLGQVAEARVEAEPAAGWDVLSTFTNSIGSPDGGYLRSASCAQSLADLTSGVANPGARCLCVGD